MSSGWVHKDWRPGAGTQVLWTLCSLLLLALGVLGFGVLYLVSRQQLELSLGIEDAWKLLVMLAITAGLLVAHELVHGLVMRLLGARPKYGAGVLSGGIPYLYATAHGHKFTKGQYLSVALAPMVLISLVGAPLVAWASFGSWLILPLAIHLSGCVGDQWIAGLVLLQPRGALIEDRVTGIRVWPPA